MFLDAKVRLDACVAEWMSVWMHVHEKWLSVSYCIATFSTFSFQMVLYSVAGSYGKVYRGDWNNSVSI